jgi:transposase-like protein
MPLQGHGRSALEVTNGRPLCPHCRLPMWLVHIDERDSDDQRYFECPRCGHAHTDRRTLLK